MELYWCRMRNAQPKYGESFVALSYDGSRATLFIRNMEGDYFDQNGKSVPESEVEKYFMWIELPEGYVLFGEREKGGHD